MAHTKTISGWYAHCNGRVKQLQLTPYIIAVYNTMTLRYIVKDHITKQTFHGVARSPRNAHEKCYRKSLELMRLHH